MYNSPMRVYSFERRHCTVFSDEGVHFRTAKVFNSAAVFNRSTKKAFVIADNKLSDMSYFDMETVIKELQELSDLDFDTMVTGFDIDTLISDDMSSIDSFFQAIVPETDNATDKSKIIVCPSCGEKIYI